VYTAYIGLGSNLGSRRKLILLAWHQLGRLSTTKLVSLSSPYESAPVGVATSHMFVNAVGLVHTQLAADELLCVLLKIEAELGRDRTKGCDRPIDLDLLTYDQQIIHSPTLTIPHPGIQNRLFVLIPLAEITPNFIHPVSCDTIQDLIQKMTDEDQFIKRLEWPPLIHGESK